MERKDLTKEIKDLKIDKPVSVDFKAQLKSFLAASKLFDEMIESGLVEKRGYNLMSIEKKKNHYQKP